MNLSWVFSDDAMIQYQNQLWQIKDIGSSWGSWRTWRHMNTDNVICANAKKAEEFLQTEFYNHCNLYLAESLRGERVWPRNVRTFAGEFPEEFARSEEAIALALAGSLCDIVLLYGFRWSEGDWAALDEYSRGFVRHTIETSRAQWVIVGDGEITSEISDLENVSQDTLDRVVRLMKT